MFTVIFDPPQTLIEGKFPQGTLECNCSDVLTGKFPQGTEERDCSNVLTSKFPQGTIESDFSDNGLFSDALFSTVLDVVFNTSVL